MWRMLLKIQQLNGQFCFWYSQSLECANELCEPQELVKEKNIICTISQI